MSACEWVVVLSFFLVGFGLLAAVANSITKNVDRTRERVTDLEAAMDALDRRALDRRLFKLEHPGCNDETCWKQRQKLLADQKKKVGFPVEFAKRVSEIKDRG